MKRLFDVTLALALLPIAIPMTLAAMLAIVCVDRQSPLFTQTRVGVGGRSFAIFKLRTMRVGTPNVASHLAQGTAITRLGRVLRRLKLDELPQIANVLTGNLSFVGPRPCLPSQTELIEERRARGVLDLLPGITGVAQVDGLDMSTPRELAEADARYIGPWSMKHDLKILVQTGLGGGRGDAVNRG